MAGWSAPLPSAAIVYNEIKTLYLAADHKYNSGLFHFDPNDKSRPDADTLSLDIRIGDGILRKIIADLYPPKSRYQFSVISADILGQVYERFLGKVIKVRSDDIETSVTVEEKPEVRKAADYGGFRFPLELSKFQHIACYMPRHH